MANQNRRLGAYFQGAPQVFSHMLRASKAPKHLLSVLKTQTRKAPADSDLNVYHPHPVQVKIEPVFGDGLFLGSPLCLTLVFHSSFSLCENTLSPWSPVTSAPPLPTNQCHRLAEGSASASAAAPTHTSCTPLAAGPPTISFEPAPLKTQVSLGPDFLCFPGPQREAHSPGSTSLEVVFLKWCLGTEMEALWR